jgi:hypothetical protein
MEDPLTVDQIKMENPKELKTAEITDPIEELARQSIWPTTSSVKAAQIRAAKATIEKRRQFERGGAATAQGKYDNLLAEYNELKKLAKEDEVLPKKEPPGYYNPTNSKDRKAERARIIEYNNYIKLIESARKALPAAKAKLDRARDTLKVTNGKVSNTNTPALAPAPPPSAPVYQAPTSSNIPNKGNSTATILAELQKQAIQLASIEKRLAGDKMTDKISDIAAAVKEAVESSMPGTSSASSDKNNMGKAVTIASNEKVAKAAAEAAKKAIEGVLNSAENANPQKGGRRTRKAKSRKSRSTRRR